MISRPISIKNHKYSSGVVGVIYRCNKGAILFDHSVGRSSPREIAVTAQHTYTVEVK